TFPFVVRVFADLVTILALALPFGFALGLLARRSLLFCCLVFFAAASITTLLWVVVAPAPALSDVSPIDKMEFVATSQDFWLFPFAVATAALCVWRWHSGHLR